MLRSLFIYTHIYKMAKELLDHVICEPFNLLSLVVLKVLRSLKWFCLKTFCRITATNVGEPGCESESSTGMWWKKQASFGSACIEVSVFTHLCTPPLPCFFFPLPTFFAFCSCTTLLLPARRSPSLYLCSVTGEFPELIIGGYPREQEGPNHLQAEWVRGDCLMMFSSAWLKTAHKSLAHMGLAIRTCMGTCTVVNAAVRHTTLLDANIAQLNLGSYGYQYSGFPQRNCKLGFLWRAYIL